MQSPDTLKILIIDGPDGLILTAVSGLLDGLRASYECCGHVYEAVRILADVPANVPVIAIGSAGELSRESGSFYNYILSRPNILCILHGPVGLDCPYSIRQAIWNGQLLCCRTREEMLEALGWILKGHAEMKHGAGYSKNAARCELSPEKGEFKISPEELDALFNPE